MNESSQDVFHLLSLKRSYVVFSLRLITLIHLTFLVITVLFKLVVFSLTDRINGL